MTFTIFHIKAGVNGKNILLALVLKFALFLFFILQRDPNWNSALVHPPFALAQLDTQWYFQPLESVLAGQGYDSVCKLPGFAPIYIPLRWAMSASVAYNVICILQVVLDGLCTVLLASLAVSIFRKSWMFWPVFLAYGCSTFVSIRSNYVLSDSLCTSFLILGLFALERSFQSRKWVHNLWAGLFMCWAFEMRPVVIVIYPIVMLLLLNQHGDWKYKAGRFVLLCSPIVVATALWWAHNLSAHQRNLILIAPVEECMTHYGPEAAAIRRFIIATGHDFQPWSAGSAAEWFLRRGYEPKGKHPFSTTDFCAGYNLDTLAAIRNDYKKIEQDQAIALTFRNQMIARMDQCTEAYVKERPMRYYGLNRLRFIVEFLFPNRIDDLPLPPKAQMNGLQWGIKSWSLLLLWAVHALAIVGVIVLLLPFDWHLFLWAAVGGCTVLVLAALGFIEQRYLTTSYPIALVYAVFAAGRIWAWVKPLQRASTT